jgi:LacI family transcriptional regulator
MPKRFGRSGLLTIKQVAGMIGVSPTTVSHVLHGRGRVSPATRQKVLKQIREIGYTPNLNAQRLVSGRTQVIALDLGLESDPLGNLYAVELTRGIQEAVQPRHYGLLLNAGSDTLFHWVKARAVDGVILAGGPQRASMAREVARMGTPCAVIAYFPAEETPGIGWICLDLRPGARQAAQLLVEQGHRRIGYLATVAGDPVQQAFAGELAARGAPLREDRMVVAGRTPEEGEAAARRLLSRPDPPTALFARTDTLAAGAWRAARSLGVRVPQDLSLIGHNDVSFARLSGLTSVQIDCLELGRLAAETLFSLVQAPAARAGPAVVQTALVVRDSVAPPPAPAARSDPRTPVQVLGSRY